MRPRIVSIALITSLLIMGISFNNYSQTQKKSTMVISNKEKAVALLNSFNTGDQTPIAYINPSKYIQHNLAVGEESTMI